MKTVTIEVRVPTDKTRDATDMLNDSIGLALSQLEDEGKINGWEYGKHTLDAVISGEEGRPTEIEKFKNRMVEWSNSINFLHSMRLSEVGIDKFGDLMDEVPNVRAWMDRFFAIVSSTYSVEPADGLWTLRLDGKEKGNFPTMQEAIETAKAKAAREGRSVLWKDREGKTHGPVKPSRLGSYSPSALRQRLGLLETPFEGEA